MNSFEEQNRFEISKMGSDANLQNLTQKWFVDSSKHKYSYHFTWLGRPIIQFPQDIIAMQEILWRVKPDLIVETGVAHGGSLIFYASMLELIGENGRVLGIDIDIRDHNRFEIEKHPMFNRIALLQGSSTDPKTIKEVNRFVQGKQRVLVVLDSNHTHEHVIKELELYSPLVTKGSYLVVFDTVIEDMPEDFFPDRPWGRGNNPKTAVREFVRNSDRFEIDKEIESKLLITVAPNGYLKCIKE